MATIFTLVTIATIATIYNHYLLTVKDMKENQPSFAAHFGRQDNYRREELLRLIERSLEQLTLQELEALYYDMSTKNYINE